MASTSAVSMWAKAGVKVRLIAAPFSTHSQTFQRGVRAGVKMVFFYK